MEGQVQELGHSPLNIRVEHTDANQGVVCELWCRCMTTESGGTGEESDREVGGGFSACDTVGHRPLEVVISHLTAENATLLREVCTER